MNRLLAAINIGNAPMGLNGVPLQNQFPNFGTLVTLLYRNAFTVIAIVLLTLLILGGIQYIMSAGSGDPKKAAQAQAIITDALIGFAIVFMAYSFIQIVQIVTGLNILDSKL